MLDVFWTFTRRMWTRFNLSLVLLLLLCGSWSFPFEEGGVLVGASACQECEREQEHQWRGLVRKQVQLLKDSLDGAKAILATSLAPSPASESTVSTPPRVAMQVSVIFPPRTPPSQAPVPSSAPPSPSAVEVPVSSPPAGEGPGASGSSTPPGSPLSTSKTDAQPPVPSSSPSDVEAPVASASSSPPALPPSKTDAPPPLGLNLSVPLVLPPLSSAPPSVPPSSPEPVSSPSLQPPASVPAPVLNVTTPPPIPSPPVLNMSTSSPPVFSPPPLISPPESSPPKVSPSPPVSQSPASAPVSLSPPLVVPPPLAPAPSLSPVVVTPNATTAVPPAAVPAPPVASAPAKAPVPVEPAPATSTPVEAPAPDRRAPAPTVTSTPAEAPAFAQPVAPAATSTPAKAPAVAQPVLAPTPTSTPAKVSAPPVTLAPAGAPPLVQPVLAPPPTSAKPPAPAGRQPPRNVVPSPAPNTTAAPPPVSAPPPAVSNTSVPLSPPSKSSVEVPAVSPSSVVLPLPPATAAAPPRTRKRLAPASLPTLAFSPASSKAPSPTSTRLNTPPGSHPSSPPRSHASSPSPSPKSTVPPTPRGAVVAPLTASIPPAPSPSPTRTRFVEPPPSVVFPAPPNAGCEKVCQHPAVTTLPGTPCGCVIPMQVGLAVEIPISTFLSLIPQLSEDLAAGTFLLQNQVQIVGANAIGVDFSNTSVQTNLVPLRNSFSNATAFRVAQRFWLHKVKINEKLFVNYTVLYVIYPGLPSFNVMGSTKLPPGFGAMPEQPLGVDIRKPTHKLQPRLIAMITLGSVIAAIATVGITWYVLSRRYRYESHELLTPGSSGTKRSVAATLFSSSSPDSALSLPSSLMAFAGSVRTLSLSEMNKATESFSPSRVIGQGGFGRVYSGVLDDETKVAVKVLIREDRQGDKEFAAEVEMLSRLHHRNLVKLVGICTDDDMRCLVYELIPNGSVESHLHGEDKDVASLSWEKRLKIALGAARALAYLHEDSYPRVIHRDFKSSNILLEHDFTPKVSDFGLAKAASEELTGHISTRVMGTFGYVAPEYAMTGHLLVKSDVYSYGVVLLELLSGRKPVDMSRAQGQENLVTWARPLLTTREGLEVLMDPTLKSGVVMDKFAKVAAIASMCVQPEVSQRPFMGEVVQALKLVCEEVDSDEAETSNGRTYYRADHEEWDECYREEWRVLQDERPLSASSALTRVGESRSFGRHSAPVALKTSKSAGHPPAGSMSERYIAKARVWL